MSTREEIDSELERRGFLVSDKSTTLLPYKIILLMGALDEAVDHIKALERRVQLLELDAGRIG